MKRSYRLLAVAGTLCLGLTACGSSTPEKGKAAASGDCTPAHKGLKTMQSGSLTVAAYVYPPFSDVVGGKLVGAEGDVINKIAKMECLDVKVVEGASAAMIPSVQSGRADTTIGSWYRTAARQKIVELGAPVIETNLVLASLSGVSTIQELKGKKVGSVLGFLANEDLKKLLGDDQKLFQSVEALYADLKAGRIDVAVTGSAAAAAQLKHTPIERIQVKTAPPDPAVASTLKPGQTNFPVNKDNAALATAMNEDVAKLRDSGELEKILVTYGFTPEAAKPGEPNLL